VEVTILQKQKLYLSSLLEHFLVEQKELQKNLKNYKEFHDNSLDKNKAIGKTNKKS
jgi:hypothetical protein